MPIVADRRVERGLLHGPSTLTSLADILQKLGCANQTMCGCCSSWFPTATVCRCLQTIRRCICLAGDRIPRHTTRTGGAGASLSRGHTRSPPRARRRTSKRRCSPSIIAYVRSAVPTNGHVTKTTSKGRCASRGGSSHHQRTPCPQPAAARRHATRCEPPAPASCRAVVAALWPVCSTRPVWSLFGQF